MNIPRSSILRIQNDPAEITRASFWLEQWSKERELPKDLQFQMHLALEEVLTNILSYAFDDAVAHTILIQIHHTDNRVYLQTQDSGYTFNPLEERIPPQAKTLEKANIGGLGIHLIRSYTERCRYKRIDGENHFTMIFTHDDLEAIFARFELEEDDLKQQHLCRDLEADDRIKEIFAHSQVRTLKPGEILLKPGDENHVLYLLRTGKLQVHLDSADSYTGFPVHTGECIGEMSIIDGQPASAFVVADEASEVIEIKEETFWKDMAPVPGVSRNLMQLLTGRMRRFNAVALEALEQRLRLDHLERELDVAHDLQISMLPHQFPLFPLHPNIDCYGKMIAAREVGGDFFDAFTVDANRICITVGDVSGKGVPAAMFMVRTMTQLRSELLRTKAINKAIRKLNISLSENNDSCMFVSLFSAVLDTQSGVLRYCSAGHNAPILKNRKGECSFIKNVGGPIAGVALFAQFKAGKIQLEDGDELLLYTDGVTEAQNSQNQFFGDQQLLELVQKSKKRNARNTVLKIEESINDFCGEAPQFDDITLLHLRYKKPSKNKK